MWVKLARLLIIAIVATGGTELLYRIGLLRQADRYVGDVWHTIVGSGPTDLPVVLVMIDNRSVAELKDPFAFWGPDFANAIATLRDGGATVIGLDVMFKVGAEDWFRDHGFADDLVSRSWDAGFRQEVFRSDVVLVGHYTEDDQGQLNLELPLWDLWMFLDRPEQHVAVANTLADPDKVVRRFRPVYDPDPNRIGLSFPLLLALRHLGLDPEARSWSMGGRTVERASDPLGIAFEGPPGSVPRLSFVDVARGLLTEQERATIRGRIAIVGASYPGARDAFATPYIRSPAASTLMLGPELHANAVSTLLSGRRVVVLGDGPRAVLLLLVSVVVAQLCFSSRLPGSLATLAGVVVAAPAAGFFAFSAGDVLLPVIPVITAALVSFGGVYPMRFEGESRKNAMLRAIFERYGSEAVVQYILNAPGGLGLGGARKNLTVLFADIRGFTALSESMTPEETVELLNEYYRRVCRPILAQQGLVDKFVGDSVMGVFGAPVERPDHARQAVLAAWGMRQELPDFRRWLKERFPEVDSATFEIGIGVHTGVAVAGNIGFDRRTDYTVIGDTVNTASRIEQLTKELGCFLLVSQATLSATDGLVQTGRATEIQVRGKKAPVRVYEVTDVLLRT